MIIIVESGATKTDWCAAAQDREPIDVRTAGMNLATMPQDVIEGIVAEAMAQFKAKGLDSNVSEVHFYAAGLIVPEGEKDFKVDYMTVVQNVYRGEAPSKYLGSFAPWILQRYDTCEYVRGLVEQNFRDFIERALMQYDIDRYPVGVVGGFGYANRNILRKVAEPYGIRFSTIIAAPIEGLVEYHLGRR